jgi:hypothetical protein
MTTDPRRRDVYMHISALPQTQTQCPEEIRVEDYLKAYSTTGRPPAPVPQEPAGESERVTLGLPPLFQPHVEVTPSTTPTSMTPTPTPLAANSSYPLGTVKAVTEPSQLPKIHAFQPLIANEGEIYNTISSLPEFQFFSHEELRCYAYAAGVIFPPTPLPTDLVPVALPPIPLSSTSSSPIVHPFFAKDNHTNAFFHEPNPGGQDILYYQSMSAAKRFDRHSPEELRVSFLQTGRELDSSQISPLTAPGISPLSGTPTVPSLFGASGGGSFVRSSPAVRQF